MTRLRTLFILIPLVFLTQTAQVVLAAPQAPTTNWKPGIYLGTITINVKDHHSTPQDVKDRGGTEQGLFYIPKTVGKLKIFIGSAGNIQFQFKIPIGFTDVEWNEARDDGQGNCRGMVSDATGRGTLSLQSAMTLTPVSDSFEWTAQKFSLDSFQATVWHIGSRCDKTNAADLRKGLEAGFKKMFLNNYIFYVNPSEDGSRGGICTMIEWQGDEERSFVCKWKVNPVVKKK